MRRAMKKGIEGEKMPNLELCGTQKKGRRPQDLRGKASLPVVKKIPKPDIKGGNVAG